ncbi:MAG TPA: hypothetical protein VGC65_11985 [Bacteroidia bacterium]|jgi:thioredoxin-related protein
MKINIPAKLLFLCLHLLPVINMNGQLITIESSMRKDDGSSSLTKKDSTHLKPFSVDNFDKEISFKERTEINFELVKAENIKELFSKHKYTWVFIQASGCGPCTNSLKKYIKTIDSLKTEDIKIIVINQDIAVKQLQKKLFGENYNYQSYILDPKIYGTVEFKKQEQFVKEITNNAPMENYSANGVPVNLFFDQNGNLIYYNRANDLNTTVIKEIIVK